MRNLKIDFEADGAILVLRVDLWQEVGLTRSRKSMMISSTDGNLVLWRDGQAMREHVNLNVFKKLPREEWEARLW